MVMIRSKIYTLSNVGQLSFNTLQNLPFKNILKTQNNIYIYIYFENISTIPHHFQNKNKSIRIGELIYK
jgi:predicted transcriptional regulator